MKSVLSFGVEASKVISIIEVVDDDGFVHFKEKAFVPSDEQLAAEGITLEQYIDKDRARVLVIAEKVVQQRSEAAAALPAAEARAAQLTSELGGEKTADQLPEYTLPTPKPLSV